MSTPLFNREPTNGDGTGPILGASLAAYTSGTAMAAITAIDDEPVLIDYITWCTEKFSTHEGMLLLSIVDGYGNRRLVGAYDLAAGTATVMASGVIELNFTLAAGYQLEAAHNVQDNSSAYTNVHIVPVGGVVR